MKKTGPTKLSTRKLIREFERKGTKSKQKIWTSIAKSLNKPSRQRAKVNLFKLEKLSKKFTKKTFLVIGKVLSTGDLTQKINVVSLSYSDKAKQKIMALKGSAMTLGELVKKEVKTSELMIIR